MDHSASLEKTLKEHKDRLSRKDAELINASRGFKELESKARKLTDQTATLSSQLEEAREALLAQERIATSLGSNIDAAKIERALVEKEWSAKLEAEIGVKEEEIVTLKKQLRGNPAFLSLSNTLTPYLNCHTDTWTASFLGRYGS